jgi:UDP-N-acetylmuramyl tripeptide synthase
MNSDGQQQTGSEGQVVVVTVNVDQEPEDIVREIKAGLGPQDETECQQNCISHLLSMIDYQDLIPEPIELPPRQENTGYQRPPIQSQTWVPAIWGTNPADAKRS